MQNSKLLKGCAADTSLLSQLKSFKSNEDRVLQGDVFTVTCTCFPRDGMYRNARNFVHRHSCRPLQIRSLSQGLRPCYGRVTAGLRPYYGRVTAVLRPCYGRLTAVLRPSYVRLTAVLWAPSGRPLGAGTSCWRARISHKVLQ